MEPPIKIDPEICHGTPCFNGSRIFVSILFDHLKNGYTFDEMMEQYPSLDRSQALTILKLSAESATDYSRSLIRSLIDRGVPADAEWLKSPITTDARISGGEPCFAGTTIPIRIVFDTFADGGRLDDVLRKYPATSVRQIRVVVSRASRGVLTHAVRVGVHEAAA